MNGNGLLKWLLLPVFALVLVVVMSMGGSKREADKWNADLTPKK